jgi:hypothetical protein
MDLVITYAVDPVRFLTRPPGSEERAAFISSGYALERRI